ncbi:MAG: hypothetical protein JWQ18_1008, partial [Conexibacter sp.]|nr:hypothetical protein [Conexibacter sp.]
RLALTVSGASTTLRASLPVSVR